MADNKSFADENENLAWEEIKREHIVQDEWIDFRKSTYRFPDGRVFEPYYSYSRRDYVVVVATDTEGRYICVRQFRQGIRQVTTEFVAGGIECEGGAEYLSEGEDPGRAEDTLAAAKRELKEETGLDLHYVKQVGAFSDVGGLSVLDRRSSSSVSSSLPRNDVRLFELCQDLIPTSRPSSFRGLG